MTLEETLTKPVKHIGGLICHDHLGEKFYSKTTMCEHWRVSSKVFEYRISHGWTQEEALTKPVRTQQNRKPVEERV